ncbi:MAG TPA: tetratricopeptide repeat protein [Gemmatimonadaceae bacterium]|nr:tetratricopeptide repeat protein [Gemmatimonadaceae bacterium]
MNLARKYPALVIAIVAVIASISGLMNGFAFDDVHVIIKNPRLHTFAQPLGLFTETYWRAEMGSMLYRPMTMVVFAIQWVIGNGSPLPFHLTSILLYAVLSAAVYRLAELIMPLRAAFAAAAVFAVHPVHVEAVANVVGQAELWVALILVGLVALYIPRRRKGTLGPLEIALVAFGYLAACSFKEHAIVLPALLLAAEFSVIGDSRSKGDRFRSLMPLLVSMAIAGATFVFARYTVLHGVAIDSTAPILKGQAFSTRFFTMLGVVTEWVRLMVWPMSLSADYSYPRIRTHDSFDMSMLPALAVLVGTAFIAWHFRKRFPVILFGVAWIGIALLIPSNLFVVTGFVLAERTLMLASVGFALCAGVVASEAMVAAAASGERGRQLATVVIAVLLVAFGVRSVTRSPVWHDNDTLFLQTVQDVPSSHRAHWMRAVDLAEKNRTGEALEEMDMAVVLGDQRDPLLLAYAGDLFAVNGRCPRAITLYRRALALAPGNVQLRANTSFCLLSIGKWEEAKAIALAAGDDSRDLRLQQIVHRADSLQQVRGAVMSKR